MDNDLDISSKKWEKSRKKLKSKDSQDIQRKDSDRHKYKEKRDKYRDYRMEQSQTDVNKAFSIKSEEGVLANTFSNDTEVTDKGKISSNKYKMEKNKNRNKFRDKAKDIPSKNKDSPDNKRQRIDTELTTACKSEFYPEDLVGIGIKKECVQ